MTVQNPPAFLQAGSHPAEDVRRALGSLVTVTGVFGANDLKVTEKSGTPNMSVDVAGGRIAIPGSEATYQGTYLAENRGTANLVISAADGTNPRKDLIVAKVQDAGYSGATNAWSLVVVTGTPAASPAVPTAPANSVTLAVVDVLAAASSITNARITDQRARAFGPGLPPPSAVEKITLVPGGNTDTTSASIADWITVGNLSAPTWASRVRLTVSASSLFGVTTTATGTMRLKVGTATGQETGPFDFTGNVRALYTLTDLITLNATGTLSLVIQGKRASGSSAMRADTSSVIIAVAEYLPA